MTKLAMLCCLKSNRRCTGAACLSTLNDRTRSFAPYEGQDRTRDSLTGNMRHTKCRRANLRESDSPGGVSYFSGRGEKKMIGLAYSFLW